MPNKVATASQPMHAVSTSLDDKQPPVSDLDTRNLLIHELNRFIDDDQYPGASIMLMPLQDAARFKRIAHQLGDSHVIRCLRIDGGLTLVIYAGSNHHEKLKGFVDIRAIGPIERGWAKSVGLHHTLPAGQDSHAPTAVHRTEAPTAIRKAGPKVIVGFHQRRGYLGIAMWVAVGALLLWVTLAFDLNTKACSILQSSLAAYYDWSRNSISHMQGELLNISRYLEYLWIKVKQDTYSRIKVVLEMAISYLQGIDERLDESAVALVANGLHTEY
ncbi:hypothetical protein DFP72DRAFT_1059206 [Ephemerocybe angulata]|uniref:Uncharacterized protein n=1 Tax=Ephemerocybe angulata TaxID=980116 RepID=A0A8H6IFU9_9AGAR|nr:hypothetical protein DFP72DRAFT_1059206 [Tulosesus angulatus]